MIDKATEIVVAMLNNGYIKQYADDKVQLEAIKKAIDEITMQLKESHTKDPK